MEDWGIFTTEKELNKMLRRIIRAGFEVFEVRALSQAEKLIYVANDPHLYINNPHIIMFKATEKEYKQFVRRRRLSIIF